MQFVNAKGEHLTKVGLPPARGVLGISQWCHYQDNEVVEYASRLWHELGLLRLLTGISWADCHRPGGRAWYDWLNRRLEGFDLLLSVWHTPPSISERGYCASPPRRLQERVFWYNLLDLDPRRTVIEGFHTDDNEYPLGLVTFDGTRKPAFDTMKALTRGHVEHETSKPQETLR